MTKQLHEGRSLIAKNSIFNLFGLILPMLVGVLTIPYIVKGLGTNGYGILSIAFMLLGYFSIFDLGLSRATVKFVAAHLSPDKIQEVPKLVWTSLSLLVALGCIGGVVMAAFVPLSVTRFFKMPPSLVGEARTSLFILCVSMPVMLSNDALRGVLEAAQRFDLVNYVKVPASILFYLAAAMAIPFGVRVSGIVLLLVLIRLASSGAYLHFAFRVFPGLRTDFSISGKVARPLAAFGGWVMVTNTVGPICGYLERFLIASVLSVSLLTYYSAPYDLVSRIIIFPASIVPSLFPYFSFHGSQGGTEVSDVTSRVLKYILLVMTPVTAVFVFFSREILQLWLGSQFAAQSAVVLQLAALIFFISAFAMIPYTSVQALGRPDLKAILDVVALPTYAFGAWWLTRRMGINGAALAKLLITFIDFSFLYAFAWKLKAFSVRDCITGPLLRALAASAAMVLVVLAIESLHAKLAVSIILLAICFATYLATFWVVAVDDEDRATIRALLRERFSGFREEGVPAAIEVGGNDVGV
jgi:O-antigen/teichoic acid export membrane protein